MYGQSTLPGTIASGASVSNIINLKGGFNNDGELVGIEFTSATWTNTHIKIQRALSETDASPKDFYKPGAEPDNVVYEIKIQAGCTIGILPADVLALRFVRIVTINGAGGSPANEGAAREFKLITKGIK